MKIGSIKKIDMLLYGVFLVYFLSYIGEQTVFKYIILVIFQLYLLFKTNYEKISFKKKYKSVVIFFIFSLLLSFIINFSIDGIVKTVSLIDLFILTCFMLPPYFKKKRVDIQKLLSIITNSVLIMLVCAFVTNYNDTIVAIGRSSSTTVRHLFGLGYPSIVGYICFVEFCLSFYLLMVKRAKKRNFTIEIIKIVIAVYMANLANIRSGLYSMIIFLFLYLYEKLPKTRQLFAIKAISLILLSGFGFLFILNISLDINTLNYIFSERFIYYNRAIEEILSNNALVFGLGPFRNASVVGLDKVQIDNTYIDMLYQYGIVVMMISILLCFNLVRAIDKKNKSIVFNDKYIYNYGVFLEAYLYAVLIYSLVEKNLFSISSALSFITFILVFWYLSQDNNSGVI